MLIRIVQSAAVVRRAQTSVKIGSAFRFFSSSVPTDTLISRPEPQVATNLMQIGTRRIFEHEHDQYRELCRRFYEEKVVPFHAEWEEQGQVNKNEDYILDLTRLD